MRRFFTYMRLHFKRTLRYTPFAFIVTLVICLCLSVAIFTVVNADNSDEDQTKISVGLVGDFEHSFVEVGIAAIKSFDSSNSFLEILDIANEDEAREMLFDGDISAYVIIPEGFVDEAMNGRVGKLKFVTEESDANILNLFREEVLNLISCILVESQNGVYAMKNLLRANGFKYSEINNMTNAMLMEYVTLIIARANTYETEVIGVSENLTFPGYMFSGVSVLMLLLVGIVFSPLFIRRDYAFPKLLRAKRCGACAQTLGEYIPFFAVTAVNILIFSFLMMLFAGRSRQIVPELSEMGISDYIVMLLKLIPAIALIVALQYLLYQFAGTVVSGVLIQFISAVLLGYFSGCLYPISFFPKTIRIISEALPSGMARGYFSSLLTGTATLRQALLILGYTVVLLALSAFVRQRRISEAG